MARIRRMATVSAHLPAAEAVGVFAVLDDQAAAPAVPVTTARPLIYPPMPAGVLHRGLPGGTHQAAAMRVRALDVG